MSDAGTPGDAGDAAEMVVLGQIAGGHALKGEVRVRYFGDSPENLASVRTIWLAESRGDPSPRDYRVTSCGSGRSREVRLGLEGVADRDSADGLRGKLVLAEAGALLPLSDDEFYWHELVGCDVFDRDGKQIGTVKELWETGAHDLLVVESEDGARHLLPTARELMPVVDRLARRIVVEVLPGMLDAPFGRRS